MVFGHAGDKIGGGEMARGGLEAAPMHEQAVGPAVEHAVEPNGFGLAQAAAVIMARGVEPGVQAGFDGPVLDRGLEPPPGGQFLGGAAGEKRDGFGGLAGPVALQPVRLGHRGEAGGFPVEGPRHQDAVTPRPFSVVVARGVLRAGGVAPRMVASALTRSRSASHTSFNPSAWLTCA